MEYVIKNGVEKQVLPGDGMLECDKEGMKRENRMFRGGTTPAARNVPGGGIGVYASSN
ncbi:hypothetical protein [Desulfobulbus sp.]|jgi:hypothetical protein|uniref:hypothetical protein n=1 Tax=Desulfobulbus sp. TaxID=895 RepID=UPI0027B94131|nr:hypothetical protein [Desulfobulbus sp.]